LSLNIFLKTYNWPVALSGVGSANGLTTDRQMLKIIGVEYIKIYFCPDITKTIFRVQTILALNQTHTLTAQDRKPVQRATGSTVKKRL
jgi:hypothetical protein